MFDYPLYKLRGLSGAVFRACIHHCWQRKTDFPYIQPYNEKFKSNARLWAWTEARLRTRALYNQRPERMCASVWWETHALVLVTEKRNSGQISLDSPVNRLSRRSAEVCKLKKTKRKANWTRLREDFIPGLPSGVANLFTVNLSVGEQNGDHSACLVGFTKAEHL